MWKNFINGLIKENPAFILVLGTCPTLAVTTSVINAIGMGLSATFVLICSNMVISMLRKIIPGKIRIASYIIVIAGFVTLVDMLLKAYLPAISDALGMFIPLIVVNCIILGRAEAFASKNKVFPSILDGLGMGLGFTIALSIIGGVREIIGAGTFLGYPLFGAGFKGATIMILPAGGFFAFGIIMAIFNAIVKKIGNKQKGEVQ